MVHAVTIRLSATRWHANTIRPFASVLFGAVVLAVNLAIDAMPGTVIAGPRSGLVGIVIIPAAMNFLVPAWWSHTEHRCAARKPQSKQRRAPFGARRCSSHEPECYGVIFFGACCLIFSMYFSKKNLWMSIMLISRPWM